MIYYCKSIIITLKKTHKTLTKLFSHIHLFFLNLICPVTCIVCDKEWHYVCAEHKKYLQKYHSSCYVCHTPTHYGEVCYDHLDASCKGMIIWFYYTNIIKELIHLTKYSGAYDICHFFTAQLLYDIYANPYIMSAYHQKTLLITYIPMHWRKEKHTRWYNQAAILAQYIADTLQVPCLALCTKNDHTKTQASLDRNARLKNTTSAYSYTSTENLSQYRLAILVDDVCTTGITMDTCASLITQKNPHICVWGLAIARNTV